MIILRLQKDVNYLIQWSRLKFNAAKYKLLKIGDSHPFSYSMADGSTSQPVEMNLINEEKDLGFLFTGDLKPSLHC